MPIRRTLAHPTRAPALTFVGTGEAVDPELANTALLYRGAATVLLDCGFGVPGALWRLDRDPDRLDAVWISHRHADHCFGLPALLLWMRQRGRCRELTIVTARGNAAGLREILELGYPGAFRPDKSFPLRFVELDPAAPLELLGLRWTAAASRHGVSNHALRLQGGTGIVCYSGDGRPTTATEALYAGADLVVHECFGAARTGRRDHADLPTLLDLAGRIDLGRLALVHIAADSKAALLGRVAAHRGAPALLTPSPGETVQI